MAFDPTMPDMRKPRVLIVKQGWDPEDTIKGDVFASMISIRGFDVEVVTSFPHYPGDKLYPGWRLRPVMRELRGIPSALVPVTRVMMYPSHNRNPIKRLATYVSFSVSAFIYLLSVRRMDVIYSYHPPITTALATLSIGWLRRVPVVVDVQDIWPDTLRATGMLSNAALLSIVDKVCRWTWRRAAALAVNSKGFKKLLIERGADPAKVQVVYNWADESAIGSGKTLPRPKQIPTDRLFRILVAGNMGPAQGLDTIVEAARLAPEICFALLGDGVEKSRMEGIAADLPNLEVYPKVPMSEVGAWLEAADALVVHLVEDPLFNITIPSRVQAYMAAGRPILLGVNGEAAELIEEARCGLVFKSSDPASLARSARYLASLPSGDREAMGLAGRHFYNNFMSFEAGIDAMVSILRSVQK